VIGDEPIARAAVSPSLLLLEAAPRHAHGDRPDTMLELGSSRPVAGGPCATAPT